MQTATEDGPASAAHRWLRGLWEYYRGYTHTAIHTAATAALTGFGLLVFVDSLFVVVAIAAYLCPPVVLYSLGADVGTDSDPSEETTGRTESRTASGGRSVTESDSRSVTESDSRSVTESDGDSDADSDGDDGDSDSDGDDGDSDSDGDDGDSDSDSDSDGADADADGSDTDTDTDG